MPRHKRQRRLADLRRRLSPRAFIACAIVFAAVGAWGCSNSAPQPPGTTQTDRSSVTAPPTTSVTSSLPEVGSTTQVDVVVYGTQTSGIAAVREIAKASPDLRVALISPGDFLESPLVQGLCVEDARNIDETAGGMYAEWRTSVLDYYQQHGQNPFTPSGRLAYQPQVAGQFLWSYVRGPEAKNVQFVSGSLVAASDSGTERWVEVDVPGSGKVRFDTTYFVDASVEADLARLLGASYRIGRNEDLYNDAKGETPSFPGPANGFVTAPQRFSALLTLKIYPRGDAPPVADLESPDYDPATYRSLVPPSQKNVDTFGTSWSLSVAKLPGDERELNETWTDYGDVGLAFSWVFDPTSRTTIFLKVLDISINKTRYLQEHGYPALGIADLPQTLYVREGPRVQGLATYTEGNILEGTRSETVAVGCYAQYDRHEVSSTNQIDTARFVYVPMGALMPTGHPWLLVSTAISTDFRAYSSAVRTEPTRANLGGAAGAIIAVAHQSGVAPAQVPYAQVRAQLLAQAYQLPR